jgi:hypothetical protein
LPRVYFIGALALASTLFVSKKKAIKLAGNYLSSEVDEENLKLTTVQSILKDSTVAKIGAFLLALGFLGQILGNL